MLKISLSKSAAKFIQSLPPKQGKQIDRKLTQLALSPIAADSKYLKGYTDLLRADSGEYRIIYRIDVPKNILMVLAVGKRNDGEVYKKFKRMMD
jgi:mRNA interferase RelE/StbE